MIVMNKWDLALTEARRAVEKVRAAAAAAGASAVPTRRERGQRNLARRDAAKDDAGKRVSSDPAKLAAEYEILVRDRLNSLLTRRSFSSPRSPVIASTSFML